MGKFLSGLVLGMVGTLALFIYANAIHPDVIERIVSEEQSEDDSADSEPFVLQNEGYFHFARTQCLGTCPVYDIYLFEDGSLLLRGLLYVPDEVMGARIIKHPPEHFDKAMEILDAHGFDAFENDYGYERQPCWSSRTDAPGIVIERVSRSSNSKRVQYYTGCENFWKEARLNKLIHELDKFLESDQFNLKE